MTPRRPESKILTRAEIVAQRARLAEQGATVTNGAVLCEIKDGAEG